MQSPRPTRPIEHRSVCTSRDAHVKGVTLEFVNNPARNTETPQGEFMMTVIVAIAELERKTIRGCQAEDIAISKIKGVYDRTPELTADQASEASQRVAVEVSKAKVARKDRGVPSDALRGAERFWKLRQTGGDRDVTCVGNSSPDHDGHIAIPDNVEITLGDPRARIGQAPSARMIAFLRRGRIQNVVRVCQALRAHRG
ncbi:recombinase family protein [Cryobacterium sp. PAMC25264]|nr:recombinase family protein [Cryobacterium sp. PAMC25264]QYF73318.1 recombinase family protein [Cryobacterium sp. PAMC25264]